MRFCTFSTAGVSRHVGVAMGPDRLLDVTAMHAADVRFSSLLSIIENQAASLPAIQRSLDGIANQVVLGHVHELHAVKLEIPFHPPQIRCFSVYERHLKNAFDQILKRKKNPISAFFMRALFKIPQSFYDAPAYYKGVRLNLSGPGDAVQRPSPGLMLDYEAELGVIIGSGGKDIPEDGAMKHVFGYVIFNDFSERTQLMKEMGARPSAGPAKGKDFDGSNSLGAWIVTADEIANPNRLEVRVSVNGELRGKGSTAWMTHRIERIINYASWNETLQPGELLATGCVPNCAGIEQWRFLGDGDRVEVRIEGLGSLTNTIERR
jgi:2-keto-4-pentenoate hydratase/2-oxohepta-3-ene-1,7-dioic acid hydratase in catechol pathway